MKSKFLRQAPRRFREILRLNDFGENRQRIQISLFHSILRLKRIRPNYPIMEISFQCLVLCRDRLISQWLS